jgi:hypothetical protein
MPAHATVSRFCDGPRVFQRRDTNTSANEHHAVMTPAIPKVPDADMSARQYNTLPPPEDGSRPPERLSVDSRGTPVAECRGAAPQSPWEDRHECHPSLRIDDGRRGHRLLHAGTRARRRPTPARARIFVIIFQRFETADLLEPVPRDVEGFNVDASGATTANTWGLSTSFVPGHDADYHTVGAFWHYPGDARCTASISGAACRSTTDPP